MSLKRQVIDVREPTEYEISHVEGAINIPLAILSSGSQLLSSTDKDTELIVYCRTGSRSHAAIQFLKERGFTKLINGINEASVRQHYL